MAKIKTLPLFPLNFVAFPGEIVNLHIFEDRYKELINECVNEDSDINSFGLPAYLDNRIKDFGTEMEVIEVVKKYDDGKMDIRVKGLSIFRIIEFYQLMPFKKYAGAKVSFQNNVFETDLMLQEKMRSLLEELFEEVGLRKELMEFNSYSVAHYIGLTLKQEYELLGTFSEDKRLEFIINHLEKVIPSVRKTREIKEQILMNGHFRHLKPPF